MLVWDFLKFYWRAETKYRLDSPFLFRFTEEVVEGSRNAPYHLDLKALRSKLLKDHSKLRMEQLGAGSQVISRQHPTVAQIARSSLSSSSQQALLYRIVKTYQPAKMLELGTSFGLSALHQQLGNVKADLISIEGRQDIHLRAQEMVNQFKHLPQKPLLWHGTFDEKLPAALDRLNTLDYLFIDGDHRYKALLNYYETCLPYLHHKSVVIIHDIYWSQGMQRAWREIVQRPEISVAIDLFHTGILFFDTDVKETLSLRLVPFVWKPWMLGFSRK